MRKKLSIKNKIVLSVTGVIIVFGVIASAATFFVSKQNFITIKKEDIKLQAIEQSHEIGQIFINSDRMIEAGAKEKSLAGYLENGSQMKDMTILETLNHYNIGNVFDPIYILNKDGVAVVSSDPTLLGNNYNFREYFKRASNGEPFIEAAIGSTTGRSGYYFAHPIRGADESIVGVLVGKISGGIVDESLRESTLAQSGKVMFIDSDGVVFYSSIPDRLYKSIGPLSAEKKKELMNNKRFGDLVISELQYSQIVDVIHGYTNPVVLDFYDAADKENEIITVVHIPNAPFFLIAEADTDNLVTSALAVSIWLSIAALFAALLAALFIYISSARLLRPLGLLKAATEKIKTGDYTYQLTVATGDEFEDVSNAFGEMAKQLQSSYADLNQRVIEKTVALSNQLQEAKKSNAALQNTQRAVLNVLEDARLLELQIQEERDRLRGILSSMGEGLFVFDKDFRVLLANATTERILGIPLSHIEGALITDLITLYHGKTIVSNNERPIFKIVSEGVSIHSDVEDDLYWSIEGGRRFAVGFVAVPMVIGGVAGGVIVFRDLTLEKNLDDARTSFISITSHQLRTPLTSLKWFLEMLMDGSYAQPLTPEQKNFADLAYQSADRMMGIINLLLQIARVEAGRVKIVPVPTDLRVFAQGIVSSLGNAFSFRKQKVEVIAVPDPLPSVLVDNDVMGQVLQNLLSNANRYALENTTITVTFKVEGDVIVCSVADKGIGITKADATRIFEKFYRAENALRLVPEGSGLGLSLVKSLVEGWGGEIRFESEEWKGTTFFFTIPLAGMAARAGEVGIQIS